jgi:DNA-binding response OmpR family regulator
VSARVLIVEPDDAGRVLMDRVLSAEGHAVDAAVSVHHAQALLDSGVLDLALIDELAGGGAVLDEVRFVRAHHPSLPVIATGTLLSQRVLLELLRLGVMEALPKPFTPSELREAVARVLARAPVHHAEALEYAAALSHARSALAAGQTADALRALARVHALAPLDPEAVTLQALAAELEGRDAEADRGYRAALALRHDEDSVPPDPYEGLARLAAYDGATPVAALDPARATQPRWLVTDPVHELSQPPSGPCVVVLALGLLDTESGRPFLRDGGLRAFALGVGPVRPGALAAMLAAVGPGPVLALEPTRARFDLAQLTARRDALLGLGPSPSELPAGRPFRLRRAPGLSPVGRRA